VIAELGSLIVLTDRTQTDRPLVDVVEAAVEAGAPTVVFREKDLPADERLALGLAVREVVERAGARFLAASEQIGPVSDNGGYDGGIHLAASDPMPLQRPSIVGRSCHNTEELANAAADGCDYATISPIFLTKSKPGYGPALGLDGLALLAAQTSVPLVALAGITPELAPRCVEAGAVAVAVMGEIMRSPDPAATTARYLNELAAAPETTRTAS
jgi:thiamine-phosphate pyrophosphorylase